MRDQGCPAYSPANVVVQACLRPTSPDGLPVIGNLLHNGHVATGGGPWGIAWGPLLGKCLASMIDDDDPPIRIGPTKPRRFDTLMYRTLMKSRAPASVPERWMWT
jgi:glycine/D-amino acid oxidase-like deaminating enzyme